MTSFLSTIPGNRWHFKSSPEGMVKILQNSGQLSLPTLTRYSQLLPVHHTHVDRQMDRLRKCIFPIPVFNHFTVLAECSMVTQHNTKCYSLGGVCMLGGG